MCTKPVEKPHTPLTIPKPDSIIKIKKITVEEKKAVDTLSTDRLHGYIDKLVQVVISKDPGINIAEISQDPLIKSMGLDKRSVYRAVDRLMATSPPSIKRVRDARSWKCFPP